MTILTIVLTGLVIMTGVMTASWLFQKANGNAGWTDVFWTFGTGAVGVMAALWPNALAYGPRQSIVAAIVALWSLRLGLFIARRIARSPAEDPRYVAIRKENGAKFQSTIFKLSLAQPPVTALLLVSIAMAAHAPTPWLRAADLVGIAILLVALGGEALADEQMRRFKADPANAGKIMDSGLWGWSRHPNYFFEWLGWVAYPVIAINLNQTMSFFSVIAPVVMYQVLNKITGVPPTEAAMVKSKGDAYRDYQSRVSPFFPLPSYRKAKS